MGAVRSSSRESDRQMGSAGEGRGRWRPLGVVSEVEAPRVEFMGKAGFWIQRTSLALARGPCCTLLFNRFPVR